MVQLAMDQARCLIRYDPFMLWELKARVHKMMRLISVSTIWAPGKTISIAIKGIPQST